MQKLLVFSQHDMSSLRAQQHTVNPAIIVPVKLQITEKKKNQKHTSKLSC
jgi:hypothetical protein